MSVLSFARIRAWLTILVAMTLLGITLAGASRANAIGLGPAGWYAFGASNCSEDSAPIRSECCSAEEEPRRLT